MVVALILRTAEEGKRRLPPRCSYSNVPRLRPRTESGLDAKTGRDCPSVVQGNKFVSFPQMALAASNVFASDRVTFDS